MRIELTAEELNFILNVLDKIQLSGLANQRLSLNLAQKLAIALEANKAEPVEVDKEKK